MTSDKYLPAAAVFLYLVSKYWRPIPLVHIFGFAAPKFTLPIFATFHSLGDMADFPVGKWSNALLAALAYMSDPRVIIMLEDYWLTRSVDTEAVGMMNKYMEMYPDVVRGDLTDDRQMSGMAKNIAAYGRLDMVESDPESQYHMSLMPAIWNRTALMSFIREDWSPWDVELAGTPALRHRKELRVVGTKQCPIRITLGLRGGDSEKVLLDGLSLDDILTIRNAGFLSAGGK